jgi:sigma-B regulation protein RsbU (phosphoserine phosphatase)
MIFYLSYALSIFKEDKAADIYSITLTNSVSVAERTKLLINEDLFLLDVLIDNGSEQTIESKMQNIIASHDDILAIECLVNNLDYKNSKNERKLESLLNGAMLDDLINADRGATTMIKQLSLGSVRLEMNVIKNFPPHFSILRSVDQNLKCAIHVSYEKLMPLMNETLNYGSYLLTQSGKVFLKLNNVTEAVKAQTILSDPTISNVQQGVKRFDNNGEANILAFAKIQALGLISITEIPEKKAFMASALLIKKSIYFGLLILSIAVIAGILFTKRMTKNVQTLFEATTLMAQGHFDVTPVALGFDEIGALTDSFVEMKDKIIMFMEEMEEKARLETELQVAHLVQHSFFPKHALIREKFSFDGHYLPASECSGDWWGYFEQGPTVTIIVCDATGHGVPAALITAAAHSCLTTLKIESESGYISPKYVLEKLNKVICYMNTDILMTAFVLEIDEVKKSITYSNASHMTPFLIHKLDKSYSKEGVVPLQENNGARLGQDIQSSYSDTTMLTELGDRIVMFSDGITEMAVDGKMWGQRNFLKSIFKGCAFGATGLIESVMSDFNDFRKEAILQDDITLVCVAINHEKIIIDNIDQIKSISEVLNDSIIITKLSNEENMRDLLSEIEVNHLIGFNTLNLNRETKLVQILESKPSFNLNDYINETYKKQMSQLTNNRQIAEVLNDIGKDFTDELKGAINLDILKLVSEELLSNAFYHSGGENVQYLRGEEISIPPDVAVEFLFASNEEYVVVSVKSPSGFSSREKIISSIKRGYVEKTPLEGDRGAGLGLYMIYENCNQFWVINGSMNSSQIICVFEKFNRYKQAKERITSFHFLAKEICQ